jgi:CRP-like cAMP-binding protein
MRALKHIFLSHGRPLKVSPEDKLLVRGKVSKRVYFVKSGQVRLHSSSNDGREIGFEVVRPGEVLGFAASLNGRSFLDETALTACDLLVMEIEAIEEALREGVTATVELLRHMTEQFYRRTRQAEGLALYSLRGRLARWLIFLAREQQQHSRPTPRTIVHLDFNQKLIAAMVGVTRETRQPPGPRLGPRRHHRGRRARAENPKTGFARRNGCSFGRNIDVRRSSLITRVTFITRVEGIV